ncbi:hypothetical protein [Rubrivirga litoralis]|uniref:Uncharacterized protein n=1 Tax=Rubrivirga litoralis TaxID=3075598 RepID=A0ABU3BM19_9BACT|nr:hypothetical protein [Rubrivirga sp. F394]MDT0630333.1 hypothetical protein [Rubrivirga sp. F394]
MTDADCQAALDRAQAWGVDLSLLRETLRLTPTERVERHQRALDLVTALLRSLAEAGADVGGVAPATSRCRTARTRRRARAPW